MSKPLSWYPESQRKQVAQARAGGEGLGALAARDFLSMRPKGKAAPKAEAAPAAEAVEQETEKQD